MNGNSKSKRRKHKFCVISKVGNDKFVKYNTSDLIKFYDFIISRFTDYRYSNVYDKETRVLLGNLTVKHRPTFRRFSA